MPYAAGWSSACAPEAAQAELVELTSRAADNWAGLGVRVNSVVPAIRPTLPRQFAPRAASTGGSRVAGGTLVRSQQTGVSDAVADSVLFLASSAASRITGHTLRLG